MATTYETSVKSVLSTYTVETIIETTDIITDIAQFVEDNFDTILASSGVSATGAFVSSQVLSNTSINGLFVWKVSVIFTV